MSCGVGCRRGSELGLPWLWHGLAAVAPIQPLAWEPPYASGASLKSKNKQTKKQKQNKKFQKIGSSRCGSVINKSDKEP